MKTGVSVPPYVEEKVYKRAVELLRRAGLADYPDIPPVLTYKQQARYFYQHLVPVQNARIAALPDGALISEAVSGSDIGEDIQQFLVRESQLRFLNHSGQRLQDLLALTMGTTIGAALLYGCSAIEYPLFALIGKDWLQRVTWCSVGFSIVLVEDIANQGVFGLKVAAHKAQKLVSACWNRFRR